MKYIKINDLTFILPPKKSTKERRKAAEELTKQIKNMPAEIIEKIYVDTKNLFK